MLNSIYKFFVILKNCILFFYYVNAYFFYFNFLAHSDEYKFYLYFYKREHYEFTRKYYYYLRNVRGFHSYINKKGFYYFNRFHFYKNFDFFFLKTLYFFFFKNFDFRANYRINYFAQSSSFLFGLFNFFKRLANFIIPLITLIVTVYFLLVARSLPFLKLSFELFSIFMLFYLLISGFVFFIKRYKYGKFTIAIQRFWRRSLAIFWLVESSTFIVFIYFLFNASQEPTVMHDIISLQKTHLYSWKFFFFKIFPIVNIIVWSYFLILANKWNTFFKKNLILAYITFNLTYILWLEFYQFFYVLNWYGEFVWLFDLDDRAWYAENTFKRTRLLNNYTTICIIAKFWHIVFIYVYWIFFLLRFFETKKLTYVGLSSNLQNFIILYVISWLLMYPWLKFVFKKFLIKNHSSFKEYRTRFLNGFLSDFYLFIRYGQFFDFNLKFFFKTKFPYLYQTLLCDSSFLNKKQYFLPKIVLELIFI